MKIFTKIFLMLLSISVCLVILEFALRFLVKPSDKSYGIFLGHELPPLKLMASREPKEVVVNQKTISWKDISGVLRDDENLGYAPQENAVSPNGWWQSNNIGARSSKDTPKNKPLNKKRIIVFGDSVVNCDGVKEEQAWPFLLEKEGKGIEVINLGVAGYGMTQVLLRYREIKNKIDYDIVMVVWPPSANLQREVNSARCLMAWASERVERRFIIENDELKLIKFPYEKEINEAYKNKNGVIDDFIMGELEKYLAKYDRFYFKALYEKPNLLGKSVLYKIIIERYYSVKKRRLYKNLMRTDSEAMQISKKIFDSINNEAKQDGKLFVLVYFPPGERELKWHRKKPSIRRQWEEMVSFLSGKDMPYIDLTEDFLYYPKGRLDMSGEGGHFGPKANKFIADCIWIRLEEILKK